MPTLNPEMTDLNRERALPVDMAEFVARAIRSEIHDLLADYDVDQCRIIDRENGDETDEEVLLAATRRDVIEWLLIKWDGVTPTANEEKLHDVARAAIGAVRKWDGSW